MTTRQQINETAANVTKMLTMMIGMPDAQVDYLFNKKLIHHMHAASEDVVEKVIKMINSVGDWYPGCGEPANGRESESGRLWREANET